MSEEPEDKILKAVGILQYLYGTVALTEEQRYQLDQAIGLIQDGWLANRKQQDDEP